jgi:23S rRNA (pseudouridine1915-N3)-methyltransferase
MKAKLITIGKIRADHFLAAAADYAERLGHYMPFEIIVAKDERQALSKINAGDYLVACDRGGEQKSSEEMAEFIDHHRNRGTKHLAFFIGGAAGIGKPILERADKRLSLSKMTFPHELAQVVILEQLYRACTILKGEPYHK